MEYAQIIENYLPFITAIPLLEIYPNEVQPAYEKVACIPTFIAEQFTAEKAWKQPRYLTEEEWVKKLWCIVVHGVLSSH